MYTTIVVDPNNVVVNYVIIVTNYSHVVAFTTTISR